MIEKGLATALRHRKDDENRSSDYDKFMIAEKTSVVGRLNKYSADASSAPWMKAEVCTQTKNRLFLGLEMHPKFVSFGMIMN